MWKCMKIAENSLSYRKSHEINNIPPNPSCATDFQIYSGKGFWQTFRMEVGSLRDLCGDDPKIVWKLGATYTSKWNYGGTSDSSWLLLGRLGCSWRLAPGLRQHITTEICIPVGYLGANVLGMLIRPAPWRIAFAATKLGLSSLKEMSWL